MKLARDQLKSEVVNSREGKWVVIQWIVLLKDTADIRNVHDFKGNWRSIWNRDPLE